jgi:hypothetical protein
MLRKSILIAVSFASIGLAGAPAQAKDRDLGALAKDSDKLVGLCNAHDGKSWSTPDGSSYGCGYKGGGGIMCDKDTGCLETTREQEDRGFPWGLAGLLGLIGLAGLTRRDGGAKANPA